MGGSVVHSFATSSRAETTNKIVCTHFVVSVIVAVGVHDLERIQTAAIALHERIVVETHVQVQRSHFWDIKYPVGPLLIS